MTLKATPRWLSETNNWPGYSKAHGTLSRVHSWEAVGTAPRVPGYIDCVRGSPPSLPEGRLPNPRAALWHTSEAPRTKAAQGALPPHNCLLGLHHLCRLHSRNTRLPAASPGSARRLQSTARPGSPWQPAPDSCLTGPRHSRKSLGQ